MTNEHKRYYLAAGLLFIALTFFAASWYVKTQQEEYRNRLYVALAEQEQKMFTLSSFIDRDEADEVVGEIIQDCSLPERRRFDELLSSLSRLNRIELTEMSGLFDACGSFYADRQAIHSMRLQRELEIYTEYSAFLALTNSDIEAWKAKGQQWQKLAALEQDRSRLTTELVTLQGLIIDLLVSGKVVSSEEITTALGDAQTAKDSLSVMNTQADELRAQLSNL